MSFFVCDKKMYYIVKNKRKGIYTLEETNCQLKAMKEMKEWWYNKNKTPTYILAGAAGTGKTTMIKWITEDLGITDKTVFATLTGKASLVLKSKGLKNSSTIHKLIYNVNVDQDGVLLGFSLKSKGEIDYKLIIIDESSMVSKELLVDLLSFEIPILFIGDKHQLPPIGENKSLFDNPNSELFEITRQAKDNPIIMLAQKVINNEKIQLGNYDNKAFVITESRLMKSKEVLSKYDQILCATNATKNKINQQVRMIKGINDIYPVYGDKVICRKNNWEKVINGDTFLLNGTIGTIDSKPKEDEFRYFDNTVNRSKFDSIYHFDFKVNTGTFKSIKVSYDHLLNGSNEFTKLFTYGIEMFNYGYAINIHQSQGSEWNNVILFGNKLFGDKPMRDKLLYTGITRAKSKLILVL